MRFEIGWASLIVGTKFTVFVSFYFVFECIYSKGKLPGAYIWRGGLTEGFSLSLCGGLYLEGLIYRILNLSTLFPDAMVHDRA